jgi:hypothetical protein
MSFSFQDSSGGHEGHEEGGREGREEDGDIDRCREKEVLYNDSFSM